MVQLPKLTWEIAQRNLENFLVGREECNLAQCLDGGVSIGPHYSFDLGTDDVSSFSDQLECQVFKVDEFLRLNIDHGTGSGRSDAAPRLISVRLLVGQEGELGALSENHPCFDVACEVFSICFLFREKDGQCIPERHDRFFGSISVGEKPLPTHLLSKSMIPFLYGAVRIGSFGT